MSLCMKALESERIYSKDCVHRPPVRPPGKIVFRVRRPLTPALLPFSILRPCRSPYLSTHPQHVPCPLPMIHSFPRLPALNMPTGRQKGRPSRGSLAPPPIPQEKGRWCWTCGRIMSRFYSLLRFVSWGLRQGGGGDWSRRGGEGGGWGSWSEISLCCLRYLLCS